MRMARSRICYIPLPPPARCAGAGDSATGYPLLRRRERPVVRFTVNS